MNSVFAIYLFALGMAAAVMLLLPHISPQRYYFAITVPAGFRNTEAGRAVLRRYYRWVLASAACAIAAALVAGQTSTTAVALSPILPLVAGLGEFLHERSVVRRLVPPQPLVQESDLAAHDRLPRWMALALPAFALPLGAAAWLRGHWQEIPLRFPVHFDAAGEPNRWAERTPQAVYGPLLYGCAMMVFLLLMAVATFYGSRRAPQRTAILKIFLCAAWLMGLVFTGIGLMPVVRFPILWLFVPVPIFVIAVLLWSLRIVKEPSEVTPDRSWILGGVYYNPQDAAIFVQKRIGFGYTFNFGNRLTWAVMGTLVAFFLGIVWLLPR